MIALGTVIVPVLVGATMTPVAVRTSAIGAVMSSTSENQRRCLSYTGPTTPAEFVNAASFTDTPTYTMKLSRGAAAAPASDALMKFPSLSVGSFIGSQLN